MTGKHKYREKELEDFLRYSQDKMSDEERNAFERKLQQDPFAAEALEGYSSLRPEEYRADLARLQEKLHRRTIQQPKARHTRAMWYRIAASVAVLLVITTVLFTLFNERVGWLDKKVAESPEVEKKEPAPMFPAEKIPAAPSDLIAPMQPAVEEEVAEKPEKKEGIQSKSAEAEAETERKAEIIEEELAYEELADIQHEEAAVGEVRVDQMAAPAVATEKKAAVKSRQEEMPAQLPLAGAVEMGKRTITGMVTSSEDEQPIPGVIITVKGSNNGTVTDLEGKFQIPLDNDSMNTLIAQFIGMIPKEIPVDDEDELMITLEPEAVIPEEVVLIGAGPGKMALPAGYTVKAAADAYNKAQNFRSATPVGGEKEFKQYVKNHIQFPEQEDVLTKAVVVLNFMVGYDGRPANITVLKSPGKAFSDEAIRLLMNGPDWQPAGAEAIQMEQAIRIQVLFRKE